MARPKTIVTKSELAGILGLSKARISQLSKREDFPRRPDGRVDREKAVKWYHDVGLAEQTSKRGPKAKVPRAAKEPAPAAPPIQSAPLADCGDGARRVAIGILQQIAAPLEVLMFARVCLRAGCTPVQAYALAGWFGIQPAVNLAGLSCDDLADAAFPEPTPAQWRGLLDENFDFAAGDELENSATWPELDPARKPAA